mmetsp:Transcript_32523/g.76417  ORF Transcript_32523/g.76417 Transcript_32523/m.76417 type:complete len:227 (+) Transcript_32523:589-1269(+)
MIAVPVCASSCSKFATMSAEAASRPLVGSSKINTFMSGSRSSDAMANRLFSPPEIPFSSGRESSPTCVFLQDWSCSRAITSSTLLALNLESRMRSREAKDNVSPTVSTGSNTSSCVTIPAKWRNWVAVRLSPFSNTSPVMLRLGLGVSFFARMLMNEVFPEPLGPMMQSIWPLLTVQLTPRTISFVSLPPGRVTSYLISLALKVHELEAVAIMGPSQPLLMAQVSL